MFKARDLRFALLALTNPKKLPAFFRIMSAHSDKIMKEYSKENNIVEPPLVIIIRFTYKCNLRCVQCGQWGENGIFKQPGNEKLVIDELKIEELKRFIDQVAWFKPLIYITGGEPFLRSDIFELVDYISSKDLLITINSNCTLLEENVEKVVKSGISYFYASLDGPKEINEKIRLGAGNSTERTINGIKALVKYRNKTKSLSPIIQLSTVITDENQDKLIDTAKFAEELGVDVFGILPGMFTSKKLQEDTEQIFNKTFSRERGFNDYWKGFIMDRSKINSNIVDEQLKTIISRKWKFKLKLSRPLGLKEFDSSKYFHHPELPVGKPLCAEAWIISQLNPNGDIISCGNTPVIMGNIKKDMFMDIWNGNYYREFRAFTKKQLFPSCHRCSALFKLTPGLRDLG